MSSYLTPHALLLSCNCFISEMPDRTISVLGGVVQDITTVTDRLPDDGETVIANSITMQPGGKGANSAVAIYRLTRPNPKNSHNAPKEAVGYNDDLQVRMVGAVGADEFGPRCDNTC